MNRFPFCRAESAHVLFLFLDVTFANVFKSSQEWKKLRGFHRYIHMRLCAGRFSEDWCERRESAVRNSICVCKAETNIGAHPLL